MMCTLLIAAVCAAFASSAQVSAQESSRKVEYPALYRAQKLPEYPEARLVSTGRQVASLVDGLRLELESAATVAAAAKYYEAEMRKLGWQAPPERFPNDKVYRSKFTRDRLVFQITVTGRPGSGCKISIVVLQQ